MAHTPTALKYGGRLKLEIRVSDQVTERNEARKMLLFSGGSSLTAGRFGVEALGVKKREERCFDLAAT